ncbi:MAG: hypothetical protein H6707_21710 [Deltaproteobacteria bacterium]|nr:hypothetical protein [Deltaproteobacteria bacterium]
MGPIAQLKRTALQHLLEDLDYVLLVVNPLHAGVKLPQRLIDEGQPVPLHIGWRLPLPVPDLKIDEHGISGTLSFEQGSVFCLLPWAALMQVSVGDEHIVWISPQPTSSVDETLGEHPAERKKKPDLRLV